MNNLILSIIIPVYNTENYIEQCLNSILCQKVENYEIICINDGSTDRSEEKVKKIQNQHKDKIKYFCKENSGVSETRNFGLKMAKGKYIWFVDSDDYIEKDKLKEVFDSLISEKKDIFMLGYNYVNENGKVIKRVKPYDDKNRYDEILKNGRFNNVWQLIILKDFIINNNIKFNSHYIIAEDMLFNLEMITKNPSIEFLNNYIYNYRDNNDSIMNNVSENKVYKKIEDVISAYYRYFNYLKIWNKDDKVNRNLVSIKFFNMLNSEMKNIVKLNKSKNEKIEIIKKYLNEKEVKFAKNNLTKNSKLNIESKLLVNYHIYSYYYLRKVKDQLRKLI